MAPGLTSRAERRPILAELHLRQRQAIEEKFAVYEDVNLLMHDIPGEGITINSGGDGEDKYLGHSDKMRIIHLA